MDIEIAQTFLAIEETGSFGRAAERLKVTQSTVSTRIKALEEQLGQPVFVRGRAGASLTPAGQCFKHCAEVFVRVWHQTRDVIGMPAHCAALLHVGGECGLSQPLLLQWLTWMRRTSPAVAIRYEAGPEGDLMEQLGDGLLDMAVVDSPRCHAGLAVERLVDEELVLVADDPDHGGPREPSYLFVDWGHDFRAAHANAFPDRETPVLAMNSGLLALQYLLDTGGAAYFPVRAVASHLRANRLKRVAGAPILVCPLYVVYRTAREDEALQTALQGLRQVAEGQGGQ